MKDLSQYSDAELESIAASASYSDADLESIARSGAPSASAEIMAKHRKNVAAGAKAYKPGWTESFETGYKQGGSAAAGLANVVGEAVKGAGEAVLNTPQRIGSAIQMGKEFFDPAAYKSVAENPIVDLPGKVGAGLITGVSEALISPRTTGELVGGAGIDAALLSGPGAAAGKLGSRLYRSVLKPSLGQGEAKAAASAARGLEEGAIVNRAGTGTAKAEKLKEALGADIDQKISQIPVGPQTMTDPWDIASKASTETGKLSKFQGASKAAEQATINDALMTFLEGHDLPMTPSELQVLKKGTYQSAGSRAYGQVPEASTATDKMIAQIAKERLEEFRPELKGLNAKEAELIGLTKDLQKAAGRISNSPVFSQARVYMTMLGGTAGAAAGGIEGGLAGALGTLALKLAMDSPGFKSRLAIAMNRVGKYSPPAAVPITAGIVGEQQQ